MTTIKIIKPEISFRNMTTLGSRIDAEFGKAFFPPNPELINYINVNNLVDRFAEAVGIEPELRENGKGYANAWHIVWEVFSDYSYLRTGKGRPVFAYDTKDYIYAKQPWKAFGKTGNALICAYLHIICDCIGMHVWYRDK